MHFGSTAVLCSGGYLKSQSKEDSYCSSVLLCAKVREPDDLNYNYNDDDDEEAVLSFAFIYNIVTELRRSSTVLWNRTLTIGVNTNRNKKW